MEDADALMQIVGILRTLDSESQRRVLASVSTFLGVVPNLSTASTMPEALAHAGGRPTSFTQDRTMSAKEFVRDKAPATDVDRVACLAYYLSHFRDTPHFKTVDISTLNIEAAQPKFSNATVAVDNARARGLLVASTKGNKQLSAVGERYVELLPDRDAAKAAIVSTRPRKSARKAK